MTITNNTVLSIVQMDAVLGDVEENIRNIQKEMQHAWESGVDIVCFPEMSVCGYMLEDKVFDKDFVSRVELAVKKLATTVAHGKAVLVGGVQRIEREKTSEAIQQGDRTESVAAYNVVYLLSDGEIRGSWKKQHLPNYDVFDEKRHFLEGDGMGPIMIGGIKIGVLVCEDCWYSDTAEMLGEVGADLIVICNASPYETDKSHRRLQAVLACVVKSGVGCVYLNTVGGQDELVFDGGSFVAEKGGKIAGRLPYFEAARGVMSWSRNEDDDYVCDDFRVEIIEEGGSLTERQGYIGKEEGMYGACVQGLRNFVAKNGFGGVLLGLSGGIDSGLSCAIALDALGADRVRAFRLPSKHTSTTSMRLAEEMRAKQGFELIDHGIDDIVQVVDREMGWKDDERVQVARENLQARVRGLLLMAESNASGWLLLTTGNKSELGVGYATIYGDMCGGYSVLKDMYKGDVYRLSAWRNLHYRQGYKGFAGEVIPQEIIDRQPSAELRDHQKDTDSLPPYEELDSVLKGLIEEGKTEAELVAEGHNEDTVLEVRSLLRGSEHKRYQSPPGVKLSRRAFGKGWRYPVTDRDS